MNQLHISADNKLEPGFMTKKQLIRAYRYSSIDPAVKVTSNDYLWFSNIVYPNVRAEN